uniref:Uncharacterized protein n=1 Tax=Timema genevievae TaxID=629358 RepID=A0A7R9PJM8_TIMGE|nr:unnamed protein product [Timema genevievae]
MSKCHFALYGWKGERDARKFPSLLHNIAVGSQLGRLPHHRDSTYSSMSENSERRSLSIRLFAALSLPGTHSTNLSQRLLSVECKKWFPCLETPFTSPHSPLLQDMCRNPLCGNGFSLCRNPLCGKGFSLMTGTSLVARQDKSRQE